MVQNNAHINDSNKPTIEIKTLAQDVGDAGDVKLAELMNDGWELLCDPAINTVPVPDALGPGWRARHYEIIKLFRLVDEDDDDGGEEDADVNTSVETLREMVKRINTATSPPTPLRKEERGENGSPPLMPLNKVTVLGVDAEHPLHVERKPLEEVTYTEALHSGKYTPEEVSEVANREAVQNSLMNLKWEPQQWGDRTWEGFVNHLPMRPFKCSPRVISGVAT